MIAPRVVVISAADVVPLEQLFARLQAVAALPLDARRRLAVQLRDPQLSGRALAAHGAALREATRAIGASLVVNDRLDLALALGADGVHLGRRSVTIADARALLGPIWISVASHSVDDVVQAATDGADAVVLSPIFPSPGKGPPLGVEAIGRSVDALARRGLGATQLLALGGVDATNAARCLAAGASGVAAIRADLGALLASV